LGGGEADTAKYRLEGVSTWVTGMKKKDDQPRINVDLEVEKANPKKMS